MLSGRRRVTKRFGRRGRVGPIKVAHVGSGWLRGYSPEDVDGGWGVRGYSRGTAIQRGLARACGDGLNLGSMFLKDGTGVLEAPTKGRVSRSAGDVPRRAPGAPSLRRGLDTGLGEDFARGPRARGDGEDIFVPVRRFKGVRFRLKGGVPRSMVGRVMAGGVLVGMLATFTAVVWGARSMLAHEPRLVIQSSAAIQITGNRAPDPAAAADACLARMWTGTS